MKCNRSNRDFDKWCLNRHNRSPTLKKSLCRRISIMASLELLIQRVLIAFTFALIAFPFEAQCVTFAAVCPNQCDSWREMEWDFTAHGSPEEAFWAIPIQSSTANTASPDYTNRIHSSRVLLANSKVARIGIHNAFLDTQFFADSLLFGTEGYLDSLITGSYPTGFPAVAPPETGWSDSSVMSSTTAGAVRLQFISNDAIGGDGFEFDAVRVCCHPSGTSSPRFTIKHMERVDGFLLGQNDVVYVNTPGTAAPDPVSGNSTHLVVMLWYPASSGDSYNVYAKCGSDPTPSSLGFVGVGIGTSLRIDIDNGYCPAGWRIAVNAATHSGGSSESNGRFSLYVTEHLGSRHFDDFRVGFTANLYPWNMKLGWVENAIRRLFGATEGAVYIENVTVFENVQCLTNPPANQPVACNSASISTQPWTCDCTRDGETIRRCDVCIFSVYVPYSGGASGGFNGVCSPTSKVGSLAELYTYANIGMGNQDTFEKVFVHEVLHSKFCLQDEYNSVVGFDCAHTMMGDTGGWTNLCNNICYDENPVGMTYYCNHGMDGTTPPRRNQSSTCWQGQEGGWDHAQSRGVAPAGYYPTEDPDHYSYVTPEFGSYPAVFDISLITFP